MAEWIVSRRDWKFAILEFGANLFHLSPEEFRMRVRDFLSFFAEDPARRQVFCLDLLPNTDEIRGTGKEKAAAFRQVVREEVAAAVALPAVSMQRNDKEDWAGGVPWTMPEPPSEKVLTLVRNLDHPISSLSF